MEYNEERVDEVVLALLYLTSSTQHGVTRAWKGHDWDVLDRLCEKGSSAIRRVRLSLSC